MKPMHVAKFLMETYFCCIFRLKDREYFVNNGFRFVSFVVPFSLDRISAHILNLGLKNCKLDIHIYHPRKSHTHTHIYKD